MMFNFATRSRSLTTPPTTSCMEMVTLPGNSVCISIHIEMIVRGYHAYQNMWIAVGEELPRQRERANFEGSFAVAVTAGELIVGHKKFQRFAQCFYDKMGQFSVELLDLKLSFLNFSWE